MLYRLLILIFIPITLSASNDNQIGSLVISTEQLENPVKFSHVNILILNKIHAEKLEEKITLDEPFIHNDLEITLKSCQSADASGTPAYAALRIINNTTKAQLFSGWMLSHHPDISALEHPIYDVSIINCITPLVQ